MRVGGKHGLMVGSMVIGFFLDGFDANDPIVTGSFNHTAKASDENNRQQVDVGEGTLPQETEGFTKLDVITSPNTGINTKEEITSGKMTLVILLTIPVLLMTLLMVVIV